MLKKYLKTLFVIVILTVSPVFMVPKAAWSQQPSPEAVPVSEEERPKGFLPWIAVIMLAAGIIVLCGVKDARRLQTDR